MDFIIINDIFVVQNEDKSKIMQIQRSCEGEENFLLRSRSSRRDFWVCPAQGQELDLMILVGVFQVRIFYDSMVLFRALSDIPGGFPASKYHSRGVWVSLSASEPSTDVSDTLRHLSDTFT